MSDTSINLVESNSVDTKVTNTKSWIDIAYEEGTPLWSKQTYETTQEFALWTLYRDSYLVKKMTYVDLAEQSGMSYNAVLAAARKWNYPARMDAWANYNESLLVEKRTQQIQDMNEKKLDIATRILDKVSTAVDNITPDFLKPSEIGSLYKIASEISSKGGDELQMADAQLSAMYRSDRVITTEEETDESTLTKVQGVLDILKSTGALDKSTKIGIKTSNNGGVISTEVVASLSASVDSPVEIIATEIIQTRTESTFVDKDDANA